MARKNSVQANGGGSHTGRPDGTNSPGAEGKSPGGESQGSAYPTGPRKKENLHGFMGHGGQSQMEYHGTGQLGEQDIPGVENSNDATKPG